MLLMMYACVLPARKLAATNRDPKYKVRSSLSGCQTSWARKEYVQGHSRFGWDSEVGHGASGP